VTPSARENARRPADMYASVSAAPVVGVVPEWSFCSAPGGLARGVDDWRQATMLCLAKRGRLTTDAFIGYPAGMLV